MRRACIACEDLTTTNVSAKVVRRIKEGGLGYCSRSRFTLVPSPPDSYPEYLLLFSEAKKVSKNAFARLPVKQPFLSDRFTERRDQDPKCYPTVFEKTTAGIALSGIDSRKGRLWSSIGHFLVTRQFSHL